MFDTKGVSMIFFLHISVVNFFNRPSVSGAVLQTPLSYIKSPFSSKLSKHHYAQNVRARELKLWKIVLENCLYSFIHISTLLFDYTKMKMINLAPSPESMYLIKEPCGIVKTPAITAFVRNPWATGWLCLFDLTCPPDFRDQVNI